MKEECLFTGQLEKSNEAYAIAKIAGLKMCQAYNTQYGTHFISVIPATVYGPHDYFNIEKGHVTASLIAKFHDAIIRREPKVVVWGSGRPRREFIYVDDVVDACMFLMDRYEGSEVINIGTGEDISIGDLARLINDVVGYRGELVFDGTKPEGVLRKLLDNSRIKELGWNAKTDLREGIRLAYSWYKDNRSHTDTVRQK
jgi:GDP-L-fucose synthase